MLSFTFEIFNDISSLIIGSFRYFKNVLGKDGLKMIWNKCYLDQMSWLRLNHSLSNFMLKLTTIRTKGALTLAKFQSFGRIKRQ
jgi:hypothetical protein